MRQLHVFLEDITARLSPIASGQEAQQIAWWLLEELLGRPKASILVYSWQGIDGDQQRTLDRWIRELVVEKKPLAYVLGYVPFLGHKIFVEPPVLIPRPETEEWVARLIALLKPFAQTELKILDLCTGSGAIGIALAAAYPAMQVIASDIAPHAVALAKKNVVTLDLKNIEIVQSDLFDEIKRFAPFDIIVANPPYIDPAILADLEPSVREWEDEIALCAPNNGYLILEKIIENAPYYFSDRSVLLQKNVARLILEIGYGQGERVATAMKVRGFCDVMVIPDYARNDRVVCGSI